MATSPLVVETRPLGEAARSGRYQVAVSLAFGILFATFIILILVPVGYYILEDVKDLGRRILGKEKETKEPREGGSVAVAAA